MGTILENANVNGEPAPASASPNTHTDFPSSLDVRAMMDEEIESVFDKFLGNSQPSDGLESNESPESNERVGTKDITDSNQPDQLNTHSEKDGTDSHSNHHLGQVEPNLPFLLTDKETSESINGLEGHLCFPSLQHEGPVGGSPPAGSSAGQNHAAAGYPQHKAASINSPIQPEITQAVRPFEGNTDTAAYEALHQTDTPHGDSNLLNGQLHSTQMTSAAPNLPQGMHGHPAYFSHYYNARASIYPVSGPNMAAQYPQQQGAPAHSHLTQHRTAATSKYAAYSPSMAARHSQQQNIAASSRPQYHPAPSSYPDIGTYNNSNTAFGDASVVKSHYTNDTNKRKSPGAANEPPSPHGTAAPPPQTSQPAKPSPLPQGAPSSSAPAPTTTKRKRTSTTTPRPTKRAKLTPTATSTTPPPTIPHPLTPATAIPLPKPTLLALLARSPWVTPHWLTAHLRAHGRAAVAKHASADSSATPATIPDTPTFWATLARCAPDWAGPSWQRTHLTAAGRRALAGSLRELAAAAEMAEMAAAAVAAANRSNAAEVARETAEEAVARRERWVGGRPEWVWGGEVWCREDWRRAEYSLAAGSMLSGGGKGEGVADQYVGMRRGRKKKKAAEAGKGQSSVQPAGSQQAQEQGDEQGEELTTAGQAAVEGQPDYPDHY